MVDRNYVDRLEAELRDLGRAVDVGPPSPTLAADVRARLEAEADRRVVPVWGRRRVHGPVASSRSTWLVAAAAVLVVVLAAGLILRDAGSGVDVRLVPTSPSPEADAPIGERADLGDPVSMAAAHALLGEDLLLPGNGFGAPDEVLIRRTTDPPVVFFLWAARDGLPEVGNTGIGLLVTEIPNARTGCTFQKMLDDMPAARTTFAHGWRAIWIQGRHVVQFCTLQHDVRKVTDELATGTLIWSEGATTYRVEATLSQTDAEALAASLE